MSIYSYRLGIGQVDAAGSAPVFSVPADATYVIRAIALANTSATTQLVVLLLNTGSPVRSLWIAGGEVAAYDVVEVDTRQVLLAGDELALYTSQGSGQVCVSGYRFTT